tara:strand:- start:153 stop:638 length:486 start_codon:yes stop_codon:yes gene_type:complete
MKPVIDRVLNKVIRIPFSECWIFTGATNDFGYGIVGTGARGQPNDRAHRITYRHFVGDIPNGMFVCHECDVPSCCNPSHLFLGTNQDNVNDMIRKGRNSKPPRNPHIVGSAHPLSKLTEEQAVLIRHMYSSGSLQKDIAKQFGVAHQTISKVVRNKRYKNA